MFWWIHSTGIFWGDENGDRVDTIETEQPSLIFIQTVQVRCLIEDPKSKMIGFSKVLPDVMTHKPVTAGDGGYYILQGADDKGVLQKERVEVVFHDDEIYKLRGGLYDKAIYFLEAMIESPEGFMTSFTAGAQSTSFSSFQDLERWASNKISFFKKMKKSKGVKVELGSVGGSFA